MRTSGVLKRVQDVEHGAATLITPAEKQKAGTVRWLFSNGHSLRFV